MVKTSSGKDGYRSFTVVDASKFGGCKTKFKSGKYVSKTPVGAAKKAFSSFCRLKRIRGVCTLFVTVKETTQGSNHKLYTYKLNRHRLKVPIIRFEGTNKEYVNEYANRAKSVKVVPGCKKAGQSVGVMKSKTRGTKRQMRPNNVRKLKRKMNKSRKNNNNNRRN